MIAIKSINPSSTLNIEGPDKDGDYELCMERGGRDDVSIFVTKYELREKLWLLLQSLSQGTTEVTFIPQAWVSNRLVEVSPPGTNTWEVPTELLKDITPDSYESDTLRHHANAPKWVGEWGGPFYITWEN